MKRYKPIALLMVFIIAISSLGVVLSPSSLSTVPNGVSAYDPDEPESAPPQEPDYSVSPPDQGSGTEAEVCYSNWKCRYYMSDTSGGFCRLDGSGNWTYDNWSMYTTFLSGIPGLEHTEYTGHYLGCKDFTNCNIATYYWPTTAVKPWRSSINPAKNVGAGRVKCQWGTDAPGGTITKNDGSTYTLNPDIADTVRIVIKWFQVCIYQTASNPDFWKCEYVSPGQAMAPGVSSWSYYKEATCYRNTTQGGVAHKTRFFMHYFEMIYDNQGNAFPRLDRNGFVIVWKVETESDPTTLIKCTS